MIKNVNLRLNIFLEYKSMLRNLDFVYIFIRRLSFRQTTRNNVSFEPI